MEHTQSNDNGFEHGSSWESAASTEEIFGDTNHNRVRLTDWLRTMICGLQVYIRVTAFAKQDIQIFPIENLTLDKLTVLKMLTVKWDIP